MLNVRWLTLSVRPRCPIRIEESSERNLFIGRFAKLVSRTLLEIWVGFLHCGWLPGWLCVAVNWNVESMQWSKFSQKHFTSSERGNRNQFMRN